jgi:DNA repair protein RadC
MESPRKERLLVRDVPVDERPRERMMQVGAESLSNQELLAILLRTGTGGCSVLDLAEQILARFNGIRSLVDVKIEELMAVPGIGPAKAVQLLAAIELGRRIARHKKERMDVIRCPQDVADLLMDRLRFQTQEHFVVLILDTKNRVIAEETISIGSLNASIVHPREVFKPALKRSAASIICAHNHPSGDPTPSRKDLEVTRRLLEAGRILGIEVLDHVVIGDHRYISLKEQGHM